jgi:hypothetical protein
VMTVSAGSYSKGRYRIRSHNTDCIWQVMDNKQSDPSQPLKKEVGVGSWLVTVTTNQTLYLQACD